MAFVGDELPGPIEFLDLQDGHSIQLKIGQFELGQVEIHPEPPTPRHVRIHMNQRSLTEAPPPGTPITVKIPVLRVWAKRLDKPSPNTYWDISAKRLIAQLQPLLHARGSEPTTVTITAHGERPTKVFSIETGGQ